MLNKSRCELLVYELKHWGKWLWKIFDDWKNPACPECGIKKSK